MTVHIVIKLIKQNTTNVSIILDDTVVIKYTMVIKM